MGSWLWWLAGASDLSDLSEIGTPALVRLGTAVWFGFRGLGKKGYLCSEGRGVLFWIGNHYI